MRSARLEAFGDEDYWIAVTPRLRKATKMVTVVTARGNAKLTLIRTAFTSAAATNIELTVNRGVLCTEPCDILGVLGEKVTCAWLAVADWRAADRSHVRRMQ